MKKILIVDIENTIYKTHAYQIKILQNFASKLDHEMSIDLFRQYEFVNFYHLFNLIFKQAGWFKRNLFYLKNFIELKNLFNSHYKQSLKNDKNIFLLQELKDLSDSESYQVIYAYWNKKTKAFMKSSAFKEEYQIEINKSNSYYWPFERGKFQPNTVIKQLAHEAVSISNVVFLSNDIKLLRFMGSLGTKTLTLNAEEGSMESYIADANINDLLTDNLLEVLNKIE